MVRNFLIDKVKLMTAKNYSNKESRTIKITTKEITT